MAAAALTPTSKAVALTTARVRTIAPLTLAAGFAAQAAAGVAVPTAMAMLDTTKTPPVVVNVYNWYDPSYMTGAAWMDVSSVTPAVVPGCTYVAGTWTYPAPPEDMLFWAHGQIATNNVFLANKSPNAPTQLNQIIALTNQVNRILLRRVGGK